MPGFVHVSFLPTACIAFLALLSNFLPFIVEILFHLGPCLPAFQDSSVLLGVNKGWAWCGSYHLLLDVLEVLLRLSRWLRLLYGSWLLHLASLVLHYSLLLVSRGGLQSCLGMVSRSGSVQGCRFLRLSRGHSRAHCVGHGHLLHVRLPGNLIVLGWLCRTWSLSGRGRRRGRTRGW